MSLQEEYWGKQNYKEQQDYLASVLVSMTASHIAAWLQRQQPEVIVSLLAQKEAFTRARYQKVAAFKEDQNIVKLTVEEVDDMGKHRHYALTRTALPGQKVLSSHEREADAAYALGLILARGEKGTSVDMADYRLAYNETKRRHPDRRYVFQYAFEVLHEDEETL